MFFCWGMFDNDNSVRVYYESRVRSHFICIHHIKIRMICNELQLAGVAHGRLHTTVRSEREHKRPETYILSTI